jgi:amidase
MEAIPVPIVKSLKNMTMATNEEGACRSLRLRSTGAGGFRPNSRSARPSAAAYTSEMDLERAESASDICFLSAVEMAALIRAKKLSAREVLEAHLQQIERVNPSVNAIVTLVADQAMESARKADEAQAQGKSRGDALGPLHGLPIAHKDLVETAGIRTTFGSPIFRDHVPHADAILVERIRRAGAITIGKTNTPEFGAGSQTFNPVFGATRNPYDLTKTCGGSSGGAAVALACGMVPIADGSDTGGSLRNPAAFCGVVGLRTAPGRVPHFSRSLAWSTLSVHGPMARTVRDAALLLSVMAGPDSRCPISIDQPGSRFNESLDRDFRGVRVAWFHNMSPREGASSAIFDPRIVTAVNAQRRVFEDVGCIIDEIEPDWRGVDEAFHTFRAWGFSAFAAEIRPELRDQLKDTIQWEIERGSRITGADLARAEALRAAAWDRMRVFQETYEYFIVPSTQVPPFSIDLPYVTEIAGVKMDTYIDWMKCCYFISMLECPSMSVPCGFTPEGLPVGLQIVGRHRDEFAVLQLAHAFESATASERRAPPIQRER